MENPGKETYVEQMERVNQTNPFMLHNRIRAVALSEDRAEVRAEITEDSLNAMQTVHGGLMFVMAEVAVDGLHGIQGILCDLSPDLSPAAPIMRPRRNPCCEA